MGSIYETQACLRFWGDDLVPTDISFLLGVPPSQSALKGSVIRNLQSGKQIIAKSGFWHLEAKPELPGDLNKQIGQLLAALQSDYATIRSLAKRFNGNLFVGLFLKLTNEGLDLSATTLELIGSLGLSLDFDVYAGDAPIAMVENADTQ